MDLLFRLNTNWILAAIVSFRCACVPSRFSCVRFSRQEYWSVLPCPPPGALLHPETEPLSPLSPAILFILFAYLFYYILVYTCWSQSPNLSHLPFPTLVSICLFSMFVSLVLNFLLAVEFFFARTRLNSYSHNVQWIHRGSTQAIGGERSLRINEGLDTPRNTKKGHLVVYNQVATSCSVPWPHSQHLMKNNVPSWKDKESTWDKIKVKREISV